MRRSVLLGTGYILLLMGIITVESTFFHPLPTSPVLSPPLPSQKTTSEATANRVRNLLNQLQFTIQETTEDTLLKQVTAGEVFPSTVVLLAENDRSALLSWIESPDAGPYFSALKEALSASFSPDLKDLRDDREELSSNRTREILSFHDTALSTERITIVHIGNTLYEFHISPEKEEHISALIDTLSR